MARRFRLKHERLAVALAKTRMSQNAWARRLGVSKSYLSQLANGRRLYPSARVRRRMVERLKIPFDELFELEPCLRNSPGAPDRDAGKSATLLEFGGRAVRLRIEPVASRHGDGSGESVMHSLLQDFHYGLRLLFFKPGFSLPCILILALGIGSNTTLYSLVHGVLLRPLPFRDPSRLMMLWERPLEEPEGRQWVSPANFLDWKAQAQSFQSMAALDEGVAVLTGFEQPINVQVASVSPGFLDQLEVAPAQGRFFLEEEAQPGSDRVVMISRGLWISCFGGASIEGKDLTLDDNRYRVVGVVSPEGRFPHKTDVWRPLTFDFEVASSRGAHYLKVLARLKPGVDASAAREELQLIGARLREAYPEQNANAAIAMIPLHEDLVSDVRPTLMVLWGSVSLILLIACANAANLFLVRSLQRNREIAIRLALGAGKFRILRQLLAESLILSLAAGATGTALAFGGLPILLSLLPFELPGYAAVRIDGAVLLYTVGVSVVCGIAFGLAPALRAWTPGLRESLTAAVGFAFSPVQNRFRNGLVVAEVALAVTLVIVAGLLLRTLNHLQSVDPGFEPSGVLTMRISLPDPRYDAAGKRQFFGQLTEQISRLPDVASAGAVAWLPLGGAWVFSFEIEGQPSQPPGDRPSGVFRPVAADYFRTMGIRVLRGRGFGPSDRADSPLTLIINETLAKRFFPDQDPLGRKIRIGYGREEPQPREVVGVVSDVRQWGLAAPVPPGFYLPHAQVPFGSMTLVVRSRQTNQALVESLKAQLWSLDRELAPSEIESMTERVRRSAAAPRFRTFLASSFGIAGVLLALFGIYGVVAFATSRRGREIGIRMVLGARSVDLIGMVIVQGLRPALAGTVIGTVLSLALSKVLSRFLFGVTATDPATFLSAAVLMAPAVVIACYIPARRALRIEPAAVLRHE